jgi:hypothetical protein
VPYRRLVGLDGDLTADMDPPRSSGLTRGLGTDGGGAGTSAGSDPRWSSVPNRARREPADIARTREVPGANATRASSAIAKTAAVTIMITAPAG